MDTFAVTENTKSTRLEIQNIANNDGTNSGLMLFHFFRILKSKTFFSYVIHGSDDGFNVRVWC